MYNDAYGEATAHNLHSSGRIILNMWRAMHQELKLGAYTFESCVAAILRMRVPEIPATVLAGTLKILVLHPLDDAPQQLPTKAA